MSLIELPRCETPGTAVLPVLWLESTVLLPQNVLPLRAAQGVDWLQAAPAQTGQVLVIPRRADRPLGGFRERGIGCLATYRCYASHSDSGILGVLQGIRRARYERSDSAATLFREAAIERLDETDEEFTASVESSLPEWRTRLVSAVYERHPVLARRGLASWLETDLPLGHLCDLIAAPLGLGPANLLHLLEERNVISRCQLLLHAIAVGTRPASWLPELTHN